MTSELEQEFYDTFGIKPKRPCYYSDTHCKNHCNKDCVNFYMEPKYLEITSDILLELMCILSVARKHFELAKIYTIQEMKDYILQICIIDQEGIYTRVQSIFKGEVSE